MADATRLCLTLLKKVSSVSTRGIPSVGSVLTQCGTTVTKHVYAASASAREGRISFDIDRLLKKERRSALKFWSQVDIGNPDECWNWQGCRNSTDTTTTVCMA